MLLKKKKTPVLPLVCVYLYISPFKRLCLLVFFLCFCRPFVMLLSLMLFKLSESVLLLLYPTDVLDLLTSIAYTHIYIYIYV